MKPRLWGRLTTKARFALGLSLIAAVQIPVIVLALLGYRSLDREFRTLAEVEAAQLRAVAEIGTLVSSVRSARRNYFRTADPQSRETAMRRLEEAIALARAALGGNDRERQAFAKTGRLLASYRRMLAASTEVVERFPATDEERTRLLDRIAEVRDSLHELAGSADVEGRARQTAEAVERLERLESDLLPRGASGREIAARERLLEELASTIEVELDRIADRTWSELERARIAAEARAARTVRNLLTTLMVTILLVLGLVFWLPSKIAEPLGRLRVLVRRIAHGEREPIVPRLFPPDETRQLAEGLAGLVARQSEIHDLQKHRIDLLERRFRVLLRTIDETVLVLDRRKQVALVSLNCAEALGLKAGSLTGRPVDEVVPGPALAALFDGLADADRVAGPIVLEAAEGGRRRFDGSLEVLRDRHRHPVQYLLVLRPAPAEVEHA